MKCKVCSKEIKNNTCVSCQLVYNKEKIVLMRHCWNIEDYKMAILKKSSAPQQ